MAAWQFQMCLVPRDWVVKNLGCTSLPYITRENCDTSRAWKYQAVNANIEDEIEKYFSRSASWHDDLVCFGAEEKTDIQLWFDDGEIDELQIRIDMRENFVSLINCIAQIASALSCCIFVPSQQKVIEPEAMEILRCAKLSSSYLYVKNPDAWFEEIKT